MPALGAGGGQGGIGGDPGAIEAAADQVRTGAAAIRQSGTSVAGHGDAVVARWEGSASNAAHERIRFLGSRTDVGADALSGLPKVLADYAQALRDAQARYAAGQLAAGVAAMNQASATTAIAAVEAETATGSVPGNDPGHVGRQRQAAASLDAATEAGHAAAAEMAGAIAAEKAANDVAAGQVGAITQMMTGMTATAAPVPAAVSPNAADRADRPSPLTAAGVPANAAGAAGDPTRTWHFDRVNAAAASGGMRPFDIKHNAPIAWENFKEDSRENIAGFKYGMQPLEDAVKEAREHPARFAEQMAKDKWELAKDYAQHPIATAKEQYDAAVYMDQRDAGNIQYANGAMVPGAVANAVLGRPGGRRSHGEHGQDDGSGSRQGGGGAKPEILERHNVESGTRGKFNEDLNNPEPDSRYVVNNDIIFDTDHQNRTVRMEAQNLETRPNDDSLRDHAAQTAAGGDDRRPNSSPTPDDGGHALATSLGGPGEAINITAMDRALNRGWPRKNSYYQFEEDLRKLADAGRDVDVVVDIKYQGDSKRPEEYIATFWVDDVRQERRFMPNEKPLE